MSPGNGATTACKADGTNATLTPGKAGRDRAPTHKGNYHAATGFFMKCMQNVQMPI